MCLDWVSSIADACAVHSMPRCTWAIGQPAHLGQQGTSTALLEDGKQTRLDNCPRQALQQASGSEGAYCSRLCQPRDLGKMSSTLVQQSYPNRSVSLGHFFFLSAGSLLAQP